MAKRRVKRRRNTWPERATATVTRRVAPRHRRAALKVRRVKKRKRNPAPLVIAGANPIRRRRRNRPVARRRYRKSYAARRYNRPVKRRSYRRNPVRRVHRRRYRRNPQGIMSAFGGFSFPKWVQQSAMVGLGIGAANIVPNQLAPWTGTSPMAKLGVQTGTAIAGGMLIAKLGKSKEMGVLFAAGVGGVMVWDLLSTYVLKGMFGIADYQLSGYSLSDEYYPGGTETPDGGMSAFPDVAYEMADDGMGAFPDTVLNY